jgi:uncharacterized membrane protein
MQPAASAARNATVGSGTKHPAPSPPSAPQRLASIDTLRGLGIVAMIAYHFVFDLRFYGVVRADFENDLFWLTCRAAIVTTFLALVGISLVLADRAGEPAGRFWRRIGVVAACALAASIGSYVVFPQTFIYFGILHCIAVSAILARPLARKPALATALGIAVIVAGLAFSHPAFDTRALSWLGFTTVKPPTQDFVPLFPWLGVVLVGIGVGQALAQRDFSPIAWLAGAPKGLRWLGRHSLGVYMVHQPVLLGLLWLVLRR